MTAATRSLRDRPLGKLLALLAVLLVAFVASRSCASRSGEISKEEAVEIAEREIAYEPEVTQVRLIRQGFQSRPVWAVSLSTLDAAGRPDRITIVLVDARTRQVADVRESDP